MSKPVLEDELGNAFWTNHAFVRIRSRSRIDSEPRQILIENKIFMGSVQSQDDIYEGRPRISDPSRPSFEEILELARRQMPRASTTDIQREAARIHARLADSATFEITKFQIRGHISDLYGNSSILSLFRTPFYQRGWASYGENGSGHAFVFDFRTPWPMSCGRGMEPIDAVPFPVSYVRPDQIPEIPLRIGPQDPDQSWRDIETALLMKRNEWADQQEERLFRTGTGPGHVEFPPDSLKAAILGYNAPKQDETLFCQLLAERGMALPLYRVWIDHENRELRLRRLL